MKQTNDYNCGPASVDYFLKLYGVKSVGIKQLEAMLKTNKEIGTEPYNIRKYLDKTLKNIRSTYNSKFLVVPSIVCFRYLNDDHYSVVVKLTCKNIHIYNVWTGKIMIWSIKKFLNSWNTKTMGNRWMLYKNIKKGE